MNVYVESNFVLELAFLQEQSSRCEEILSLVEGDADPVTGVQHVQFGHLGSHSSSQFANFRLKRRKRDSRRKFTEPCVASQKSLGFLPVGGNDLADQRPGDIKGVQGCDGRLKRSRD